MWLRKWTFILFKREHVKLALLTFVFHRHHHLQRFLKSHIKWQVMYNITRLKILSSVWPRVIFFAIRDDFLETIFSRRFFSRRFFTRRLFPRRIFSRRFFSTLSTLCWQLMSTNLSNYVGFLPITLEYTSVQLRWNLSNCVGGSPIRKNNNNNF